MPRKSWSAKRERQYAHIMNSLLESGKGEQVAEEIAARTINKERAQHDESEQSSASSINDMSASRRGGLRSHQGAGGRTLAQLRNEATQRAVKGRSRRTKAQLEQALQRRARPGRSETARRPTYFFWKAPPEASQSTPTTAWFTLVSRSSRSRPSCRYARRRPSPNARQ